MAKNTGKTARNRSIEELKKYIWSLQRKCDSICKVNEQMINQYCRFLVMSDEVSQEITDGLTTMEPALLAEKIDLYQKLNKVTLNLYKVLKFDSIKDELADYGNRYTKLLKDAEQDGDF